MRRIVWRIASHTSRIFLIRPRGNKTAPHLLQVHSQVALKAHRMCRGIHNEGHVVRPSVRPWVNWRAMIKQPFPFRILMMHFTIKEPTFQWGRCSSFLNCVGHVRKTVPLERTLVRRVIGGPREREERQDVLLSVSVFLSFKVLLNYQSAFFFFSEWYSHSYCDCIYFNIVLLFLGLLHYFYFLLEI